MHLKKSKNKKKEIKKRSKSIRRIRKSKKSKKLKGGICDLSFITELIPVEVLDTELPFFNEVHIILVERFNLQNRIDDNNPDNICELIRSLYNLYIQVLGHLRRTFSFLQNPLIRQRPELISAELITDNIINKQRTTMYILSYYITNLISLLRST